MSEGNGKGRRARIAVVDMLSLGFQRVLVASSPIWKVLLEARKVFQMFVFLVVVVVAVGVVVVSGSGVPKG